MKKSLVFLVVLFLFEYSGQGLYAQLDQLHGDQNEFRYGEHTGNQFRLLMWNDGKAGAYFNRSDLVSSEWPINSGKKYLGQTMIKIGAEVYDANGLPWHIFSESAGRKPDSPLFSEDLGPNGEWQTFLPLPYFAHPESEVMAMKTRQETWPNTWPDKMGDMGDPGWQGAWNGYFGKDRFNADEESYFVMDDYQNKEFSNKGVFYPDSTDLNRGGLGMRISARNFQWRNPLVEDVVFAQYDVKNISTTHYDKLVFAQFAGPAIGNQIKSGGDNSDDNAGFDLDQDLVYVYDKDNTGNTGWQPTGFFGMAFLETPGNPFDGIDNDNDGMMGAGPVISESLFEPVVIKKGDIVVVIDYSTYKRTTKRMPDTLHIENKKFGRIDTLTVIAGQEVIEVPNNLLDDNLNGLIDENNGSTLQSGGVDVTRYIYDGLKYIDYVNKDGSNNPMIEEFRDDGIDNDGNWDVTQDDVGLDGLAGTGDFGEGDGRPTSGWQPAGVAGGFGETNIFGLVDTGLPGEPHIDKTDIHESDMIGLTGFHLDLAVNFRSPDDEWVWNVTRPGVLNDLSQNSDSDVIFSSGYFPMKSEQIERFSIAHIMGGDLDDLLENKKWANESYAANYKFQIGPEIPKVRAIYGDRRVQLFWDSKSEESYDPLTGYDFEGYRIYRSTDPGWNDMKAITDGRGNPTFRQPLAQYDLVNEYTGYADMDVKGVKFYLGNNTGLTHTFIDSTVTNGQTYYYAVVAYDHGTPPTESIYSVVLSNDGTIEKSPNVVIVTPQAAAAGYIPDRGGEAERIKGTTAGKVFYQIDDPSAVRDNHTYQVVFADTFLTKNVRKTAGYDLVNVTTGDTLLKNSTLYQNNDVLPYFDGFQLSFFFDGDYELTVDSISWNRNAVLGPHIEPYYSRHQKDATVITPAVDFQVIIGEMGAGTSVAFDDGRKILPSIPVNFMLYNTTLNQEMKFAFDDQDVLPGKEGMFTAYSNKRRKDVIITLSDSLVPGWTITLQESEGDTLLPVPGDTLNIVLNKPYLSGDVFEFTPTDGTLDKSSAAQEMEKIRVVPNPYIVTNVWEPPNLYASGRGDRVLQFTHLPPKCSIKIFNVKGQLLKTLEHDEPVWNGAEIWNMRTEENLDISYGIYVYHVKADGIGEKIGKFIVIK